MEAKGNKSKKENNNIKFICRFLLIHLCEKDQLYKDGNLHLDNTYVMENVRRRKKQTQKNDERKFITTLNLL